MVIKDSRDRDHQFILYWNDFLCLTLYFLDRKRVVVDDSLGWIFVETSKSVTDPKLKVEIDNAASFYQQPRGGSQE